ncbi:VWA domain-containing protein [Campylobacter sp. FMV-PI01]|uniref:VWA domain-containing protein n=1 Tax=Campylobacter portucalensis TaxID=2608384 RepID=A0A6L5WJH6_9BACT|nr:VWA domain-containing protein [Campylobacter portucalensis]MSN96592.1 VWA domain-containing protein [Campylobacter portucalensis]
MKAENFVNEMLNAADSILAVGSSFLPVKSLRYWYVNSHSIGMNYVRNNLNGMNSYQASGKIVGNTLTLISIGKGINLFSKSYIGLEVGLNASGSYIINHYSPLGNYMSDVFDTYVRNADEFYTRLYSDEEYRKEVMQATKDLILSFDELKDYYGNLTPEKFWEDIKYTFGRPPSSSEGSLVYNTKIDLNKNNVEIINTDKFKKEEIEKSIIKEVIKHKEIKTLTLNSQTYNIKSLSNLELRNAILYDYIPNVSFLLSNISIKSGESIDLGEKGLYKVKSGDTLSTIAEKNGLITKELLKLNPHLIDEGRVNFLQDKVLITIDNTSKLNNKNHQLIGDNNAQNLLIDSNGGDNLFVGGNKKDIMKSTKDGYDTYHAGDKDIIEDSDGKGEIYFNNTQLIGGILDKDKSSNSIKVYLSEDKNIEYHLDENSKILKVIDKNNNNAELTINNFNKEEKSLNINLADNLGKEVAIIIDTTGSMQDDIDAAKNSAKEIARNIFKTNIKNINQGSNLNSKNTYSKISIVTFSDNNIKTIGTYTNYSSFQKGINSVYEQGGGTEYHCAAMLEGMSNFTPNNGLNKEIYLMSDESGDDNERMNEVIAKARNFGNKMISFRRALNTKNINNSNESIYDNSVKINVISINNNQSHLKRLSDETGGIYFQPNSIEELKDSLFDASNLGTNKDETIVGNDKDNIINGKGGKNILEGKKGSDTYKFDEDFNDSNTIIETNLSNLDNNIIDLTKFSIDEFKFKYKNNDLIITKNQPDKSFLDKILNLFNKNTKDTLAPQIKIDNFFNNKELIISSIKFSDYSIDKDTLTLLSKNKAKNIEILSDNTTNNKLLLNKFKSSFIVGNKTKSNYINSSLSNDTLIGGNKSDVIISNLGDDILMGNKGNDYLSGKGGDDTYLFRKGDGNDIVYDDAFLSFNDKIEFIDISSKDVKIYKDRNDLIIHYSNEDSVRIKDNFGLGHFKNKIENFKFSDTTMKYEELIDKIGYESLPNNYNSKLSNSISKKASSSSFFSQNQINKVIEDLNSYGNDNAINLNSPNDMKNNSDIIQIYANGWGR